MSDATCPTVKDVADVRAGYPFRGRIAPAEQGPVWAVQMKDADRDGPVRWPQVVRTRLPGRKPPGWLQAGDVLVVARGQRFHALCLDQPPGPAVCSPHFFHLRLKPGVACLPEFLAWLLNRAPAQRRLARLAEGSDQLSIRRAVLEAVPLATPALPRQQALVALSALAAQEKKQLEALIRNRQQQLDALAYELLAVQA